MSVFIGSSWLWSSYNYDKLELYDKVSSKEKKKIHKDFKLVQHGMLWANDFLRSQKRKPIYCQPDKLGISGEQSFNIFRKEV